MFVSLFCFANLFISSIFNSSSTVISNTERSRSIEITNIEGKNIDFETLDLEENTIQFKIHDPLTGIYILKAKCLDGSSFVSRILIK
jgi:hypothetical protein